MADSKMPKVYVIDDSMSVCFAIERMLRARGMEVASERSGEAALRTLEKESPDLVLCDLVLPDIEGFEICRFIQGHRRLSSTPVIVISGIIDDSVRAEAHRVGAMGALKKPFATEELVELVEGVLGHSPAPIPVGGAHRDPSTTSLPDTTAAAQGSSRPGVGSPAAESFDSLTSPSIGRDGGSMDDGSTDSGSTGSGATDRGASRPTEAPANVASWSTAPPSPGVEAAVHVTEDELAVLEEALEPLAVLVSLRFACLLTPEGDLRGFGPNKPEPDELAHIPELVRFAAAASGRVQLGRLGVATFEADEGVLLVMPWQSGCLLTVGIADLSCLGKARYVLRQLAAGKPIPGWNPP